MKSVRGGGMPSSADFEDRGRNPTNDMPTVHRRTPETPTHEPVSKVNVSPQYGRRRCCNMVAPLIVGQANKWLDSTQKLSVAWGAYFLGGSTLLALVVEKMAISCGGPGELGATVGTGGLRCLARLLALVS